MDTSSNDSAESEDKVTIRKGSGLKIHIKLGGDKDRTGKSEDADQKRISTVKRPPSKFRSTGCYLFRKDLCLREIIEVTGFLQGFLLTMKEREKTMLMFPGI